MPTILPIQALIVLFICLFTCQDKSPAHRLSVAPEADEPESVDVKMVREINGLGGIPSTNKTADQGSKKPSGSPTENARSSAGNSPSDDVQLSSEARTLQALTEQVKELPDANLERAEQIRQALESGQYKIDDLVVADKLLQAEALFGK